MQNLNLMRINAFICRSKSVNLFAARYSVLLWEHMIFGIKFRVYIQIFSFFMECYSSYRFQFLSMDWKLWRLTVGRFSLKFSLNFVNAVKIFSRMMERRRILYLQKTCYDIFSSRHKLDNGVAQNSQIEFQVVIPSIYTNLKF